MARTVGRVAVVVVLLWLVWGAYLNSACSHLEGQGRPDAWDACVVDGVGR